MGQSYKIKVPNGTKANIKLPVAPAQVQALTDGQFVDVSNTIDGLLIGGFALPTGAYFISAPSGTDWAVVTFPASAYGTYRPSHLVGVIKEYHHGLPLQEMPFRIAHPWLIL